MNHSLGILSQVDGNWIYLVIFLLILMQEIGVPFPVLPSEVVLLGGGFLASQNKISPLVAGALATSATLIGNSLLFLISRRFGRAALDRYGEHIHMHSERVDRIEAWISTRGTPILLYGPLVPILRAYVPAIAGLFGVPYRYYIVLLAGAAAIWSFGLIVLGDLLGEQWFNAVMFLRHNVVAGLLVLATLAIAAFAAARTIRRYISDDAPPPPEHPPAPITIRFGGATIQLPIQEPDGAAHPYPRVAAPRNPSPMELAREEREGSLTPP